MSGSGPPIFFPSLILLVFVFLSNCGWVDITIENREAKSTETNRELSGIFSPNSYPDVINVEAVFEDLFECISHWILHWNINSEIVVSLKFLPIKYFSNSLVPLLGSADVNNMHFLAKESLELQILRRHYSLSAAFHSIWIVCDRLSI